jgi:aryl sulfotransferase
MEDHRRVLLLRVDEGARDEERPAGRCILGRRAQIFINQGKNGRWTDVLTPEERAEYETLAVQKLGPECARWLATGEILA